MPIVVGREEDIHHLEEDLEALTATVVAAVVAIMTGVDPHIVVKAEELLQEVVAHHVEDGHHLLLPEEDVDLVPILHHALVVRIHLGRILLDHGHDRRTQDLLVEAEAGSRLE
jgi:hypothetical protein